MTRLFQGRKNTARSNPTSSLTSANPRASREVVARVYRRDFSVKKRVLRASGVIPVALARCSDT